MVLDRRGVFGYGGHRAVQAGVGMGAVAEARLLACQERDVARPRRNLRVRGEALADGVGLVLPVSEGVAAVVDLLEGLLLPGLSVGRRVRFRLSARHHVELLPQPYFDVLLDLCPFKHGSCWSCG